MIMTQWRRVTQSFTKIYLSLCFVFCVWEGTGDRTELQHIDPHSIGHYRVSFLFSYDQLGAWGPTLLGAGFLYRILSPTGLVFLSSLSYMIVQSPTQYLAITGHRDVSLPLSLEWHVWLSSSGNNCHAVHRSLSSGASVYDCTARFKLDPYCQADSPTLMEYALLPSLEWNVWRSQRSIYNTTTFTWFRSEELLNQTPLATTPNSPNIQNDKKYSCFISEIWQMIKCSNLFSVVLFSINSLFKTSNEKVDVSLWAKHCLSASAERSFVTFLGPVIFHGLGKNCIGS